MHFYYHYYPKVIAWQSSVMHQMSFVKRNAEIPREKKPKIKMIEKPRKTIFNALNQSKKKDKDNIPINAIALVMRLRLAKYLPLKFSGTTSPITENHGGFIIPENNM